ncbi:type I-E CRISPR-associated protein Cas6/Cse3/CasE [Marinibacterium profundimaris]|uniref:CRISPR-associated protein Cse3 n=1 Tax=Marinibacterium profundimaris TaxID=1679460 RepID=A0A225NCE2_9RHOB|nr:type I-E CRISPR-associated protein Cas6/Cse3/CasE [Marinibacterium profundimaris]OWU68329.1 CRISPR-associated protein Cse3 [Marinibacterium profundimaris]
MSLYLSRLSLSRAPSVAALGQLIDPQAPGAREDAHHRLLWSAFAGDADQDRDFLWRAEGRGHFTTLSRRPPADSELFDPPEVKPFAPDLAPGDALAFVLRANATRTVKTDAPGTNGKPRRKHHDVVMDRLRDVPAGEERAARRMDVAQAAGADWLAGQGLRHGFHIRSCVVRDYSVRALPSYRGPRRRQPQFGVLDLTGEIEIRDPEAFLNRLAQGFGRAKAFGCGLMLIRRA